MSVERSTFSIKAVPLKRNFIVLHGDFENMFTLDDDNNSIKTQGR